MLELSMTLPIKVQNGGLFISRGVGRHPARRLESWEIIFVEKGRLTIQEEERIFLVDAGESLLLWPNRQHVGVEDFPADLKFYWLHFEVKAPDSDPRWLTHLSVPQQTKVADPQALHALLDKLAKSVTLYLNAQIKAGAQAVMIFDTWGGVLTGRDYQQFSLYYMHKIVDGLLRENDGRRVPVTLFTKGGGWPCFASS